MEISIPCIFGWGSQTGIVGEEAKQHSPIGQHSQLPNKQRPGVRAGLGTPGAPEQSDADYCPHYTYHCPHHCPGCWSPLGSAVSSRVYGRTRPPVPGWSHTVGVVGKDGVKHSRPQATLLSNNFPCSITFKGSKRRKIAQTTLVHIGTKVQNWEIDTYCATIN